MIQNDTEYNEIYLTIPIEYVELYKELMIELLKKGNNILNCCDCNCKSKSTRIIFDCWCAFQSAIAAKKLGQDKNPVRRVEDIKIYKIDKEIYLEFTAKSFLHNQIRIMVGLLIDIGRGFREVEYVNDILIDVKY